MKQLFFVLMVLLVACTPATQETPAWQQPSAPTPASQPSASQPEPVSGVTSTIGGQTSSADGIQPTGNTKNIIMTIDSDGYQPPILTVIPGDRIKLTITNEDSKEHAFILKTFNVDKTIAIGGTIVADFTPLQ
ncbi:cupredoxin domain-containing protein [Candidatus Woesearchaeota archaeon]|nr:cupredoxin domain-containing protein [Candidatus Woesearchaeota archaeon]